MRIKFCKILIKKNLFRNNFKCSNVPNIGMRFLKAVKDEKGNPFSEVFIAFVITESIQIF